MVVVVVVMMTVVMTKPQLEGFNPKPLESTLPETANPKPQTLPQSMGSFAPMTTASLGSISNGPGMCLWLCDFRV